MKFLIYLTPLFLAFNLFALDIDLEVDNAYEITLKNNSNFSAYFIHQTTKSIKFSNIDSTFSININDIKTIKEIEDEYVLVAIYPYIVNKYYWFKYKNGKKRRGKFIKIQEPYLFLKSGQLDFKVKINDIDYLSDNKEFSNSTKNNFIDCYFMRSTAFPTKRNNLQYSSIYTYANLKYALHDNFSIGIGLEAISFILLVPIYNFNADFYLPISKYNNFSFGINYTGISYAFYPNSLERISTENNPNLTNIGAKYSYGSKPRNITIGIDFMKYTDQDYSPAINISGILNVSKSFFLVSENNLISGNDNLILYSINGFKIKISNIYINFGVQTFLSENDRYLNGFYREINSKIIPILGIQSKLKTN